MSGDLELAGELRSAVAVIVRLDGDRDEDNHSNMSVIMMMTLVDLLKAAATRLEGLRDGVIEECAKVCEEMDGTTNEYLQMFANHMAADRIRALKSNTDTETLESGTGLK